MRHFDHSFALDWRSKMSDEYITLPLKDGTEYVVSFEDGKHYESMFPNINVGQAFCAMLVWLECNDSRRKTRRGIKRFIASWLIKESRDSYVPSRVSMEAQVGRRY